MTWLSTMRLARRVMPELDAKKMLEAQMSAPAAQAAPAPAPAPVAAPAAPVVLETPPAAQPASLGELDNQMLLLLR